MIKFRAWDEENKEMLDVHGINFDAQCIWTNEMIDDESDGDLIFLSDVELMQATGVRSIYDDNSTEIYEGDIVKTKASPYGRFIGYVGNAVSRFEVRGVKQYRGLKDDLDGSYVVLGNKFQNPELLEDE
ncbi:YopX family protein [Staphylococcus hominis]